ncbi:MAG: acyl carrier protein [Gammaproteobacteria bacterium]|nr:acyl carrier protein [Gammaproteobacteria bacterium]
MSTQDATAIEKVVIDTLVEIAPDIDPAELEPGVDLRQDLDIDSMDFLNFVIALHEQTRVEIPEVDYPKLSTLNGAIGYLSNRI